MTKVKHTVQAQRKFALGAVVPVQPEWRVKPTPAALPPPEPHDVQHCGMPATQLLNLIVMRTIHPHVPVSQPVVLLERLNEKSETHDNVKKLPKEKKKKKAVNQKESPLKQQPTLRSLRSQSGNTKEERKRRISASSTDIEDDRPLKFLRKINRVVQKKTVSFSTPTKCRVSLRQLNQRTNKGTEKNDAKREIEKPLVSTKITKGIKLRKRRSSALTEATTSRVRARTAPHTRARHAAAAPPSPGLASISTGPAPISDGPAHISPGPTHTSPGSAHTSPRPAHTSPGPIHITSGPDVGEKSPEKPKTPKATQFRKPGPRRRPQPPDVMAMVEDKKRADLERCACGSGCNGNCEHCSILSSVIAMGSDELERVVADLVDRAQRSPSVKSPTCPAVSLCTGAGASAGASTAPDVYVFNEEAEVQTERSPFRASRPRLMGSRATTHPHRSASLDPAISDRAPDTEYIVRVLEIQTRVLSSYINGRDGVSDATHKHINKLIQILGRYKKKLNDSNQVEPSSTVAAQATPAEIVIIDDDVPKREPPDRKTADVTIEAPLENGLRAESVCDDPQTGADNLHAPLSSELADDDDGPEIAEAPAFYPTKEEMKDLNYYVETIEPVARKYGIFKIVPPRDFQPPCQLKNVQFKSTNQYISSMYSRWGPAAREMTAIKAHLATQNVAFTRPPLFEGVEVDLVKLYQLVQEHGGLIRVIDERKWAAIAEKMQLNARAGRVKADVKLDKIFMKYLLPYDTLSEEERKGLRARVASSWRMRYLRQRARAKRPLHRQLRLLGESESSDEDEESEPPELATAFLEVEDCVVPGSNMNLTRFRRVGDRVRDMRFPGASAGAPPHWAAVERAYWQLVRSGDEHVCVHGAALDTSQDALGFPAAVDAPYGNHPWNLKRLGESDRNVLSSLGPTLAVTVPTLHLGMMFSTNCWHHDPHHLPWTEYMHQGPPKIWYGIADSESGAFRAAAEQLCPTAVQHKALWLPSDTAMLPPRLLAKRGVRLVRALQAPGEYVVVLPRAFSCSISTGLTVSESLYFAGDAWLDGVDRVFAALRADAEPSMFALEALLEGVVRHPASPPSRLLRARALLLPLLNAETKHRRDAAALGVRALSPRDFLGENRRCSKTSWQVARDECHVCRATLYWSKIINISTRVSVCMEHGLDLLQTGAGAGTEPAADETPLNLDGFFTILFYSDGEISQLITDLNKRLSN